MTASCFRAAAARHGWPVLFLILNAAGLALLLQEVRSLRRPPGRLAVVRLEPAGEATPEAVSEIAIEFGSPLDPKTVRADAVRLTPPVAGTAILARERFLRFRLARPLGSATEYRVALAPDLRGRAGELLPRDAGTVRTTPLAVTSVSPAGLQPDRAASFRVLFNLPVAPGELATHLRLAAPDGSSREFRVFGTRPERDHLVLVPDLRDDRFSARIAPRRARWTSSTAAAAFFPASTPGWW